MLVIKTYLAQEEHLVVAPMEYPRVKLILRQPAMFPKRWRSSAFEGPELESRRRSPASALCCLACWRSTRRTPPPTRARAGRGC